MPQNRRPTLRKTLRDGRLFYTEVTVGNRAIQSMFMKRGTRMYDYLVVGAGLFGAVFAQQMKEAGKSVLVIDKRDHIAGNM